MKTVLVVAMSVETALVETALVETTLLETLQLVTLYFLSSKIPFRVFFAANYAPKFLFQFASLC